MEWAQTLATTDGSSPPTWGIRWSRYTPPRWARFIPTYVGHTTFFPMSYCVHSVHPHLRGAYRRGDGFRLRAIGSSPPTWGIRCHRSAGPNGNRFIPTYVGHTRSRAILALQRTVHPHLRGAYLSRVVGLTWRNGSSPPTWGIRGRVPGNGPGIRFIPTYVGHTWDGRSRSRKCSVHPHLRGAYVHFVDDGFGRARFIPTYVGHTSWTPWRT